MSAANTSIPDGQPIIRPDKALFLTSVCELMTKATESYQTHAQNPMSHPHLTLISPLPHPVSQQTLPSSLLAAPFDKFSFHLGCFPPTDPLQTCGLHQTAVQTCTQVPPGPDDVRGAIKGETTPSTSKMMMPCPACHHHR